MNETETQESTEQLPANCRQTSSSAEIPSTSDNSPKPLDLLTAAATTTTTTTTTESLLLLPKQTSICVLQNPSNNDTDSSQLREAAKHIVTVSPSNPKLQCTSSTVDSTTTPTASTTIQTITTPKTTASIQIDPTTTTCTTTATTTTINTIIPTNSSIPKSAPSVTSSLPISFKTMPQLFLQLGLSNASNQSSAPNVLAAEYLQNQKYCNLHMKAFASPTISCKSLKSRRQFHQINDSPELKKYTNEANNNCMSPEMNLSKQCSKQSGSSEHGVNGLTSESETSESSTDDYIHQSPKKINFAKKPSDQFLEQTTQNSIQYPLQFVCVELNCGETSKVCCAKCLSSGAHENHEAICLKTLDAQLSLSSRSIKLKGIRESIRLRFSDYISKFQSCEESILAQFDAAFEQLESNVQNPSFRSSVESSLSLWKAFYLSESSPIIEHSSFVFAQCDALLNQISSKTANLDTQNLLLPRQLTAADVIFQRQVKSIEAELAKFELDLSSRAKQTLAVMPQFNFVNPECENISAISMKRFDFDERVEFAQIDRAGNQNGRCLIFWRDGAYRIGYTKNGESQGKCRMIWENGNVYEGTYVNDCKHGTGSFVKFSDNTSYYGDFNNDVKHGNGIEYYTNSTYYIGAFKNWKPHGTGSLIHTQTKQILHTGTWKAGKFIAPSSQMISQSKLSH